MRIRITAIAILLALMLSSYSFGQQKEDHKLVQFQMAILKKGPKWDTTKDVERNQILHQHLRNVVSLLQTGKAVIAGPFGDDSDLAGIFIFRSASVEEAKTGSTLIRR